MPGTELGLFAAACCLVGCVVLAGCSSTAAKLHVSGTGVAVAASPSATATAGPAADGVQQVVIVTTEDDHFTPDVVIAGPGRVRFTVRNPTDMPHDFAIPSLGVHSATIFAGDSAVVTVDLPRAGHYQYVCTFHEHEGMTGELIVR